MGYNRGNSPGGGNGGGYNRGGGNGGQKFQPQPGSGTLFVKTQKRTATGPDYDGYFIADRLIQPGEKIKLVGWDKDTGQGHMINLKAGREQQQDGNGGFQQGPPGGFQGGAPQQGYGNGPQNYGGQAPQQGYNQPNPTYGNGRGGYQAPAGQHQPGAYQGGGYGGQPAQTYPHQQPMRDEPPPAQTPPPAAQGNFAFPPPAPNDDLPF